MLDQGEQRDLLDPAVGGGRATTLGQLCADLGPELVEIEAAPQGLDVPLTGVAFHDPTQPIVRDRVAGRVLLAVGLSPERDAPGPFMRAAAAAGAGAIACRVSGTFLRDLIGAAEAGGVSLLAVPDHVEWGELYELIRAAVDVDPNDLGFEGAGADRPGLHDLFALADATAAVAGGPVTIDDMQSRILAFSGISGHDTLDQPRMETILNRKVPERWRKEMRERGMIEHLLTSDEVLHVDLASPHTQSRRAVAIRLGASVLGSIWLAGDDDVLSPDADEALKRAASIAALLMTRQRIGVSVERRTRESRVATLLREGDPSRAAVERVGLSADEPLVVVMLEAAARSASSPAPVGPRLIDLLAMHLHPYERPTVATTLDQSGPPPPTESVYVLTTSRGAADRDSLRRILADCVAHATKALGIRLRAGIGYEVREPEAIPLARRSAEECLELAVGEDPVTVFETVADRSLLAEVESLVAGRAAGPSSAYLALVSHDEEHGTEYLPTLRSFFDSFGNPTQVARRHHLHVNTVRYRVKRASEITGVDFDDAEARLALELELRARASDS
ncbi:MAG: helix-turn-helix domain-containing protein [Solirubrobacterales bacterium]